MAPVLKPFFAQTVLCLPACISLVHATLRGTSPREDDSIAGPDAWVWDEVAEHDKLRLPYSQGQVELQRLGNVVEPSTDAGLAPQPESEPLSWHAHLNEPARLAAIRNQDAFAKMAGYINGKPGWDAETRTYSKCGALSDETRDPTLPLLLSHYDAQKAGIMSSAEYDALFWKIYETSPQFKTTAEHVVSNWRMPGRAWRVADSVQEFIEGPGWKSSWLKLRFVLNNEETEVLAVHWFVTLWEGGAPTGPFFGSALNDSRYAGSHDTMHRIDMPEPGPDGGAVIDAEERIFSYAGCCGRTRGMLYKNPRSGGSNLFVYHSPDLLHKDCRSSIRVYLAFPDAGPDCGVSSGAGPGPNLAWAEIRVSEFQLPQLHAALMAGKTLRARGEGAVSGGD